MSDKENTNNPSNITIGSILGEIVWLMIQSKRHRYSLFLADLEWLVMPPIMEKQFRIFHQDGKPVGVALWAFVSKETDERLAQGASRLKVDEWKSGNEIWLMDIIAPFGQADKMIEELRSTSLENHIFKSFITNEQGKRSIVEYIGTKKQN